MAAPTLSRAYYTRNNAPLDDNTTAQRIAQSGLHRLKAHLMDQVSTGTIGPEGARPASSIWSCISSSDGTTYNSSGDAIGSAFNAAKWVRAAAEGTAHTWIQLYNANAGVYLIINYIGASDTLAQVIYSRTAFTGGSLTNRPTSTAEWYMGSASNSSVTVATDTNTSAQHRSHFTVASNGEFFYATSRDGTGVFYHLHAVLNAVQPDANDDHQSWSLYHGSTSGRGAGVWASLATVGTCLNGRNPGNTLTISTGGMLTYTFGSSAWPGINGSDGKTGQYRPFPAYVVTYTTVTAFRGTLPDVWAIGTAAVGSSYPTAAAQTHMIIGDALVPSSVVPII